MREKDQARYFFRKDHPLEKLICQNDFKQIDKAVAWPRRGHLRST
jgi:hypothetical protein